MLTTLQSVKESSQKIAGRLEQGRAPTRLVASEHVKNGDVTVTRPLFEAHFFRPNLQANFQAAPKTAAYISCSTFLILPHDHHLLRQSSIR
jgi:hypothetical protein